jgi:hypothetical protein
MARQQTLDLLIEVRILAGQHTIVDRESTIHDCDGLIV